MATWDSTYDRGISIQRRSEDHPPEDIEQELRSNVGLENSEEDGNTIRVEGRGRGNGEGEKERYSDMSAQTKRIFSVVKFAIAVLLFLLVLGCSVLSKLALVSLTDRLRNATYGSGLKEDKAVTIYWQLLLVITIPNAVSFIRSFVFGVFGKTRANFPWPSPTAIVAGAFASLFEVLAISVLVYIVLPSLLPDVSILLLNGVFTVQILIDISQTKTSCCTPTGYRPLEQDDRDREGQQVEVPGERPKLVKRGCEALLENRTTKILAFLLQFLGICALGAFSEFDYSKSRFTQDLPVILATSISIPIVLFILSLIWSNRMQEFISRGPSTHSARFKSCFINSGIKLVLYPFISYAVIRYANPSTPYSFDPWCIKKTCSIDLTGDSLPELITQIVASFLGYFFAWVACTMTLGVSGLALPLSLCTPLAFIWYCVPVPGFPRYYSNHELSFSCIIGAALYFSEILAMAFYLFTIRNVILAKDSDMFIAPHYDAVFLEQQMMLNRQVTKCKPRLDQILPQERQRMVYICTPMYRESEVEMNSLLSSIKRIATHLYRKRFRRRFCENFECHIFFDKGVNGHQFQPHALQFLSLIKETLGIDLSSCKKIETPYGYQLFWDSACALATDENQMPFVIHLKDEFKVKSGKRWSQVMYMKYVLKRMKLKDIDVKDAFILMTDADVSFTTESVLVLLDLLISNSKVGAVCTRIHPAGSGPLYWYQIFDYAVGHWLMKPAEHILGSVLCCPGCFSAFRCEAIKSVLEEYSSEVETAPEFLIKDMGEDRWLSTLLIKRGWRLEYCAASKCQTYCPVTFSEFFKQRRRWIASTIANLALLISKCCTITQQSDTVSFVFIFYQALLLFATSVSPATVVLIIASGFQSVQTYDSGTVTAADDKKTLVLIVFLVLTGVVYGIVCVYASQKTQIDLAKVLTFFSAIAMTVVIVGLITEVVSNIFDRKPTDIEPAGDNLLEEASANVTVEVFHFPVSISTFYLGLLAVLFTLCALFHLAEIASLFHCIWYILALPSGYFFLIIYAAANLDSQSWGTREQAQEEDEGMLGWIKYAREKLTACFLWCFRRTMDRKREELEMKAHSPVVALVSDEDQPRPKSPAVSESDEDLPVKELDEDSLEWLKSLRCEHYQHLFQEHGYTDLSFMASMNRDDFEAIGIDKRGYVLRLEQAAKRLPKMTIETVVPGNVESWLAGLQLEEYERILYSEGYETREDIANLKELNEFQLHALKITKRAHVKRLLLALNSVSYPTEIEGKKREIARLIDSQEPVNNSEAELARWKDELKFWKKVLDGGLRPRPPSFTPVRSRQKELRSLRNSMLALLLLINLMWIILLYTLHTKPLIKYGLDQRAVQLIFLAVYGVIIVVQFICMICHRAVSLVHYAGRFKSEDFLRPDGPRDDFYNVSGRDFSRN